MLWLILFGVSAVFLYLKLWRPYQYWEEKNIPFIKSWPIVGSMSRVFFQKTSFAEHMQNIYYQSNKRYIGLFNFLRPSLMITDIELIKEIAIKGYDSFLDHQGFVDADLDPLFGKSLFSLKGQKWRNMRSTLSPAFTSSKMRSMFILISECADQFSDQLLKICEPNNYKAVEMKDIFTRFANDVIASCAFGIKCESLADRENEFYVMGKRATNLKGIRLLKIFLFNISSFLIKLFKVRIFEEDISNFFRHLVKSTIDVREKQGITRPDLIHLLMEARKGKLKFEETVKSSRENDAGFATVEESEIGKQESGELAKLTDDDITAQAVSFFFAGFETVSTLLCHLSYELCVNPDIQKRLQEEVDEMFGNCNGKVTYEAVTKMKYLDMVVSETMRKWPAIMTDRVCTRPYTIEPIDSSEKPLKLEKGDVLWFPIFAIQRDSKYFSDPEKFDPERFSEENKKSINPASYIPFGVGPRNCIGSRFALLEAKTIYVYLLSKFDIVVDKKTEIPLKLSRKDFNLVSDNGFWVGLKPRTK